MIKERDGLVETTAYDELFTGVNTTSSVDDQENIDSKSFLLAVNYEATDNLTIDYIYDYNDVNQTPTYAQVVSLLPGGIFDPGSASYAGLPLHLYTHTDRQETVSLDGSIGGESSRKVK